MTIQEASYLLFEWFKNNDYFNINSDYNKVIKGKNLHKPEILVKCSLYSALESMEKGDLISSVEMEGSKYWILNKKFENMSQDVTLSGLTCQALFKVLTDCASDLGLECKTDPMSITDDDIQAILWAVSMLREKDIDGGHSLN